MKRIIALVLTMALLLGISPVAFAQGEPEPFDLNNCTVEQLMSIPDAFITREIAEAWIRLSKEKPFMILDDLFRVPGLDNKMLQAIQPVEKDDGSLWYDPDNADAVLAPSKC